MRTTLSAVNFLIGKMGLDPIDDVDTTTDPLAHKALVALHFARDQVQSRPLWFNREDTVTLMPDEDGYLHVPPGAFSVRATNAREARRCVERGGRLYNASEQTFVHEHALEVTVRGELVYEDIPQIAQQVILWLAVLQFLTDEDGDRKAMQVAQRQLQAAEAALARENLYQERITHRNRPAVARVIHRPGIPLY